MAVVISNYKIHEKVDPGFDKQFQKSLYIQCSKMLHIHQFLMM